MLAETSKPSSGDEHLKGWLCPESALWNPNALQPSALYFDQLFVDSPFRLSDLTPGGGIVLPELISTPTNATLLASFKLACKRYIDLYAFSPLRKSGVLKPAPQLDFETDLVAMAAEYIADMTPEELAILYSKVAPSTAVSGTTLFHLHAALYSDERGIDARLLITAVHLLLMYARVGLADGERVTLLTDHVSHATVLLEGLRALQKSEPNRTGLSAHKQYREQQAERLFRLIISTELPLLPTASHDDLLWLRAKLRDELDAFRIEVRSLAIQLRANAFEPEFEHEARDIVVAKVTPKVAELKRRLRSPGSEFVKRLATDAKSYITAGATVALSLHAGTPPELAAGISLAAAAIAAAIGTNFQRSDARRDNTVTFLISASNRLEARATALPNAG